MKSDQRDETAEDVFRRAIDLPFGRRASYVEDECGDNTDLRDLVNRLLVDDERASREAFLEGRVRAVPTLLGPDSVDLSCESTISRDQASDEVDETPTLETVEYPPAIPPSFGRYKPSRLIGVGGFCEVWEAFDTKLERLVALKTPRSDRPNSPRALQSLQSEAKKLAGMDFPGIVRIYDVGEYEGTSFIVSELRRGGSLATRLKSGALSLQESLDLAVAVSSSLHFAHTKGLVHRDVKPANILYDEHGNPALADFGLAVTEREQLREGRGTLGTVAYMAPEQARGNSKFASPRSDVFSLGVVLYECLTGRLPFAARTLGEYREQLIHREPTAPSLISPELPPSVDAICLKCLAKSATDRFATARDLSCELASLRAELHAGTRRRPTTRLIAFSLALLFAFVSLFFAFGRMRSNADRDATTSELRQPPYPVELPWTMRDALTTEVLADGNALRVASEGSGWLSFGTLDRGTPFSIEISQHRNEGRLGIFQQFITGDPQQDAAHYYVLLFTIDRRSDDAFEISAQRVRVAKKNGHVRLAEIASLPIPQWATSSAVLEAQTIAAEVQIRINGVSLDNAFVESVGSQLRRNFPKMAYSGHFGIWFDDCQARLAWPKVSGRSLEFIQ